QDLFWWSPFGMNNIAIHTGQANRFYAAVTKCGKNVCVDLAGEDHLRHFERRIISHSATVNDRLFDAHLLGEFAQLFAAAVDHTNANTDLMKQCKLFGK